MGEDSIKNKNLVIEVRECSIKQSFAINVRKYIYLVKIKGVEAIEGIEGIGPIEAIEAMEPSKALQPSKPSKSSKP